MNHTFYLENCYILSKIVTKRYSTSFSYATSLLEKEHRKAIYAIYGFVRLADEIVDSFHEFDKPYLLQNLHDQLTYALKNGISTNPILASFSDTVRTYNISISHIDAFMQSMKFDLSKTEYKSNEEINNYIYGSADVVGLMCLKVFCNCNNQLYSELEYSAQRLGSAFQKVNFLRDLKNDNDNLGRIYFPEMVNNNFDKTVKQKIETSIENDFREAWDGIIKLQGRSKLAVALAYLYYLSLFKKIKNTDSQILLTKRIRISNFKKYMISVKTIVLYSIKAF